MQDVADSLLALATEEYESRPGPAISAPVEVPGDGDHSPPPLATSGGRASAPDRP